MANKKSKTNIIFNIVALVGALVAAIGLFLNIYTVFASSKYGYEALQSFKMFEEWPDGMDAFFCTRLFEILAIVAIVAIVVSVVFSLVTGKAGLLNKVLNLVAIAAIVVAIICAIIFMLANKTTEVGLTFGIKGAVGFYMIAFGGVIGSVAALLGARK